MKLSGKIQSPCLEIETQGQGYLIRQSRSAARLKENRFSVNYQELCTREDDFTWKSIGHLHYFKHLFLFSIKANLHLKEAACGIVIELSKPKMVPLTIV
jgi:hypothetical protein